MSNGQIVPKKKFEIARHQVAICGRVLDKETRKPIAGAMVTISTTAAPAAFLRKVSYAAAAARNRWDKMTERPDRTVSRADGLFYFLDLPDGKYTMNANLPQAGKRYGDKQEEATVSRDAKDNIRMAAINFELAPTIVKGKVTVEGEKTPLLLATVRVKGSGEQTYSDKDGNFALVGIEGEEKQSGDAKAQAVEVKEHSLKTKRTPAKQVIQPDGKKEPAARRVEVFAQGYLPGSGMVRPVRGETTELLVKLVRDKG